MYTFTKGRVHVTCTRREGMHVTYRLRWYILMHNTNQTVAIHVYLVLLIKYVNG